MFRHSTLGVLAGQVALLVSSHAGAQGAAVPAGPAPSEPPNSSALPAQAPAEASGGPQPAYPAAAPAEGSDTIHLAQPPLPPLAPRSRHYHDGFYLRFSLGFGSLGVASKVDGPGATGSSSGQGLAIDALAGGTPAPGLVIGGGVLYQDAFDPDHSVRLRGAAISGLDSGTSSALGYLMVGPMIDAFPNPSGGFHVGGLVGPAWVTLKDDQGNASTGIGVSAWGGYAWWASSQTSVGGLVRLSGAFGGRRLGGGTPVQYDVADVTRSIALLFSVVYH